MQTHVLTTMRVQVYKVRLYDVMKDEPVISRRMATRSGAAKMGGEIVPGTETLITSDLLEPGEEWTKRDFVPEPT